MKRLSYPEGTRASKEIQEASERSKEQYEICQSQLVRQIRGLMEVIPDKRSLEVIQDSLLVASQSVQTSTSNRINILWHLTKATHWSSAQAHPPR